MTVNSQQRTALKVYRYQSPITTGPSRSLLSMWQARVAREAARGAHLAQSFHSDTCHTPDFLYFMYLTLQHINNIQSLHFYLFRVCMCASMYVRFASFALNVKYACSRALENEFQQRWGEGNIQNWMKIQAVYIVNKKNNPIKQYAIQELQNVTVVC